MKDAIVDGVKHPALGELRKRFFPAKAPWKAKYTQAYLDLMKSNFRASPAPNAIEALKEIQRTMIKEKTPYTVETIHRKGQKETRFVLDVFDAHKKIHKQIEREYDRYRRDGDLRLHGMLKYLRFPSLVSCTSEWRNAVFEILHRADSDRVLDFLCDCFLHDPDDRSDYREYQEHGAAHTAVRDVLEKIIREQE